MLATVPLTDNGATYSAPIDVLGNHAITATFSSSSSDIASPVAPASLVQQVLPVALETDPATGQFALYVGGTLYNDTITVSVKTAGNGNDQYSVQIDTRQGRTGFSSFKSQGSAHGTIEKVIAFGVGTSDVINVNCGSSVSSELFGGPGVNRSRGAMAMTCWSAVPA